MASKCRTVITACSPRPQRRITARVTTMAKPENIAPTTK